MNFFVNKNRGEGTVKDLLMEIPPEQSKSMISLSKCPHEDGNQWEPKWTAVEGKV